MACGLDLASGSLESGLQATGSVPRSSLRLMLHHSFSIPQVTIFPWMFKVQLMASAARGTEKSEQSKNLWHDSVSLLFSEVQNG